MDRKYSGRMKFIRSHYRSETIGKGRLGAMKLQLVKEMKLQDYAAANMISHKTRE